MCVGSIIHDKRKPILSEITLPRKFIIFSGAPKTFGCISGKRLSVQKTYEARDGFTELQGWIDAFF